MINYSYSEKKQPYPFQKRNEKGPFLYILIIFLLGVGTLAGLDCNRSYDGNIAGQFASSSSAFQTRFNLSDCGIAALSLHGTLLTYIPTQDNSNLLLSDNDLSSSEKIVSLIQKADQDERIKAILIEVDSPGGEPVAGEEIANALRAAKKPTVAVIRQIGTSAAYWAATGAGKIFASKNSDVGSIGVTASYVQNTDPSQKFIQISVGKYKDIGNPNKPITEDEKALILRDVNIVEQNFIQDVSSNRGLSLSAVSSIADGSSMLGEMAKELGLIDDIGDISAARKYLSQKIGRDAQLCFW